MKREMVMENEILSENELDSVVGGGYMALSEDSEILNDFGFMNESYGNWYTAFNFSTVKTEVVYAWKQIGIKCIPAYWLSNKYFLDGKQVTRTEALKYAISKCGKSKEEIDAIFDTKGYSKNLRP